MWPKCAWSLNLRSSAFALRASADALRALADELAEQVRPRLRAFAEDEACFDRGQTLCRHSGTVPHSPSKMGVNALVRPDPESRDIGRMCSGFRVRAPSARAPE